MAIVTSVEREENKDPYLKKIGLVTLEDIIEEIIDEEIEDEYEGQNKEAQREKKEQLLALFTQRQAGKVLLENELKAVKDFLSNHVTPFLPNRMKPSVLEDLVYNAEVLEIESDKRSFTHKTDENAIIKAESQRTKSLGSRTNASQPKMATNFNKEEKDTIRGTAPLSQNTIEL